MPIIAIDSGGTGAQNGGVASGGSGSVGTGSSTNSSGAGSASSASGGPAVVPLLTVPGSAGTSGIVTTSFGIYRDTPDRGVRGPGYSLGRGATVTLRPQTNAGAVNTQDAFFSTNGSAKVGPRVRVAPTSNPITVRVRNLNDLEVYSTVVGEGFEVDVQEG